MRKRFSLEQAYKFGISTVIDNFWFFMLATMIGGLSVIFYLVAVGLISFWALHHNLTTSIQLFAKSIHSATGPVHHGDYSIFAMLQKLKVIPPEVAKHLMYVDVASVDVRALGGVILGLIPAVIALKLFVDLIRIGWNKVALDLMDGKSFGVSHLYAFYELVPAVVVVNLIVGLLTIAGTAAFVIPGIFLYQRLRFAPYFVIGGFK